MPKRGKYCVAGAIVLAATLTGIYLLVWSAPASAEEVMRDFYGAEGRAEDMLADPIILNADLVAPVVIEAVKDPQMELRRYAIGFLGSARVEASLPVLRHILEDKTEIDYFRSDALESIYLIDRTEGTNLAREHADADDHLGYIAKELLSGTQPYERTYWQALTGAHDCG